MHSCAAGRAGTQVPRLASGLGTPWTLPVVPSWENGRLGPSVLCRAQRCLEGVPAVRGMGPARRRQRQWPSRTGAGPLRVAHLEKSRRRGPGPCPQLPWMGPGPTHIYVGIGQEIDLISRGLETFISFSGLMFHTYTTFYLRISGGKLFYLFYIWGEK